MKNSLVRGQWAVITGASSGIGEATARALAAEGCHLLLGARRRERLERLAKELTKDHGIEALALDLDVTQPESCHRFADEAFRAAALTSGRVAVLVNNAGLALGLESLAEANPEDWERTFQTNVMGVLRMIRDFVPRLSKQPGGAHLIQLGSIAGHRVYEGGGVYCASKHALTAINDTLRLELLGKPIRITSIDPGMVETEFSQVRFGGDAAKAKKVYEGMTPLSADDIADCIRFAVTRPAHVNIDRLFVNPTDQAFPKVHRRS